MLFVVSKSKLYDKEILSPIGGMKRNPAPNLSLDEEPSKYNFQTPAAPYKVLYLPTLTLQEVAHDHHHYV